LSPSRLAKTLIRRLRITSREQPTQYDIEALEENVRRVGLVIRFRWVIVAALAVFSVAAVLIYTADSAIPRDVVLRNMGVPAFALVFVLAYNTYYQLTYRYLGNVAILNHAQLLFDTLVITVLIHYSGGVDSWFYTMYALIIVEAAFIFARPRDTWIVAGAAGLSYGSVLLAEYSGIVRHLAMPLISAGHEHVAAYAAVRFLWTITLLSGTALVSLQMMARVRRREARLSASSTTDETTGLTNRAYFHHKLGAELQRARCYGLGLAVLLVDIDEFGAFNRRFGIDAGNTVIREVAQLLSRETCESADSGVAELNTVSRYGGEEFAIILPAPPGMSHGDAAAAADALARRLCEQVGALRVDDMGVTVSIGVSLFPEDGRTPGDLVAAADQAVFIAAGKGGNRVGSSEESMPAVVAF
jgi:diguanylate cyclase (GGDEF)-like protein